MLPNFLGNVYHKLYEKVQNTYSYPITYFDMLTGMLTCPLGSNLGLLIATDKEISKYILLTRLAYMQLAHWVGSNSGRLRTASCKSAALTTIPGLYI